MGSECLVHDSWRFDNKCTCSPERKWARDKMLQESLEKLAGVGAKPTHSKGSRKAFRGNNNE